MSFISAGLQDLTCLTGDINSAYFQAYTRELVYTIAGPEFGPLEGRIAIIVKALYGLQTSGNEWHSKFADDLFDMGYKPSRADQDVWMKRVEDHYEYIAVFVDDVIVFSRNPEKIFEILKTKYGYEFKEVCTS